MINKSVKKIEAKLSDYISKSCIYKIVKRYTKIKSKINYILHDYYKNKLYRTLKWFSFINRQKSESKMINKFKKIFGSPKKAIVCIGDKNNK